MSCKQKFCNWLLRIMGWKIEGSLVPDRQCIFLGAPHTTIMDFVVSYLFYAALGGKAYCMIKSDFFFPPLGWILRSMGGIPVTQNNRAVFVRQIIKAFEEHPNLQLANQNRRHWPETGTDRRCKSRLETCPPMVQGQRCGGQVSRKIQYWHRLGIVCDLTLINNNHEDNP